jgi:pullulanase/glycogen debranching enzyme
MSEGKNSRIREGSPQPRGATWDGKGTNFSVFSANATKVELCIFDGNGERELERIALPEYTNQIWHGYLPDVQPVHPTATASMDHMNRPQAIVSIPTSYSSTPMRMRTSGS